jgi:hypothetical protein
MRSIKKTTPDQNITKDPKHKLSDTPCSRQSASAFHRPTPIFFPNDGYPPRRGYSSFAEGRLPFAERQPSSTSWIPIIRRGKGILHVKDTHHSSREGHPSRQGHPSFVEGRPSSTSRTPTIRRGMAILHDKDTHHSSREGHPPRQGYPPFVEGRPSPTSRIPILSFTRLRQRLPMRARSTVSRELLPVESLALTREVAQTVRRDLGCARLNFWNSAI